MSQVKVEDQVCKFDKDSHTYRVDGQEIPGVTTVTGVIDKSTPLIWWAVNNARDYILEKMEPGREYDEVEIKDLAQGARLAHKKSSSDATTIGTIVHQFAEDWLNAEIRKGKYSPDKPDLPHNEKAKESAEKFLKWLRENEVEPKEIEQMVYHPMFGYAGTYDLKAEVNGKNLIIDFKTSKDLYKEYDLQATAYLRAEEQRSPDEDLDGFGLIRFPKDSADFEAKIVTDQEEITKNWSAFNGCLAVYNWQN